MFGKFCADALLASDKRPPVQRFPVEGRTPHERLELWLHSQASGPRGCGSGDARDGTLGGCMSALGHKQTLPRADAMSVLPQKRTSSDATAMSFCATTTVEDP